MACNKVVSKQNIVVLWHNRGEGLKEVKETVKHYDWSFTTTYKGSLVDNGASKIKVSLLILISLKAIIN